MAKWWATWGSTVLWCATAIVSTFTAYRALEQRIDRMDTEIALRLQRIEIVLRIDPLTRDVPIRTATEVK